MILFVKVKNQICDHCKIFPSLKMQHGTTYNFCFFYRHNCRQISFCAIYGYYRVCKKKRERFFFSKKKGTTSLSLIRKVQRSFLDAQLLNVTLLLSLSCPYCQPLHIGYTLNSIQKSVFPFLNLQYMHLDQNSLVPYLKWSGLIFV